MFSCEFCEISKTTFFTAHLWATASLSRTLILTYFHQTKKLEQVVGIACVRVCVFWKCQWNEEDISRTARNFLMKLAVVAVFCQKCFDTLEFEAWHILSCTKSKFVFLPYHLQFIYGPSLTKEQSMPSTFQLSGMLLIEICTKDATWEVMLIGDIISMIT